MQWDRALLVDADPNLVRIWWLGMSFFIGAKTILIYAALMLLVPHAKNEGRNTALVDAETPKAHIVKGDAKALLRYFAQLWGDVVRKFGTFVEREERKGDGFCLVGDA